MDELEANIKQPYLNRLVPRIVIGLSVSVALFASSRMRKGEKDIVADSETNAATPVPEKQQGSTSHAIDIDVSGTSPNKNGAKNTFVNRWIENGDNSMLVRELESYEKKSKEAERKIQKVPMILRAVHKCYDPMIVAIGPVNKCYDPMIVAIGPYHHHKKELKQMEALKIQLTLQYAYQSGKSIQELYKEMEELLIGAKNDYAEDVVKKFNDKEFAEMMFLDSCFVIQFMYNCVKPEGKHIRPTYIERPHIMRDIMLLENQLPFKILTKLMSLSSNWGLEEGNKMIDDFISRVMNDRPTKEEAQRRKTCFWFCQTNSKSKGTREEKKEPIHLLELVKIKFVDGDQIKEGSSNHPSPNWCAYRSVKELNSVGIYFRPSESSQLSDITFKSMYLRGRLRLPRITINERTKSLLLNLVAFESCPDALSGFGVSSYVCFMDTLIDSAEDVKELRSEGIILNLLGNDEQVAKLFNEISENLVADIKVFGKVKNSLDTFYKSNSRLWLAEFLHNHFRSPWTVIAFLAAIAILLFTIAQTIISAIQL